MYNVADHDRLVLHKYNLDFRDGCNILVCQLCKCVLGKAIANHIAKAKHHGMRITPDDVGTMSMFFSVESPYLKFGQPPLQALDFL